jgi:uncharacterized membrane protein YsdA (DUF1294 family)
MTQRKLRVTRANRRVSSPYRRAISLAAAMGVPLLLGLGLVAGLDWVVSWLIAWSLATFVMYGLDKQAARAGSLRTPELVLHGLALIGGFPGGWAGRAVFRHKTRHPMFLVVLTVSTTLWAGAGVWWFFLR